ncbi:MAG: RNA pseudouridine synthase, partial [Prevotella sp.]|nr:RNA pseudouridine synthase [Prevotella sp.]
MKRRVISQKGDYDTYVVEKDQPLLEFLFEKVQGQSRSKIKATLQGHGVLVGKTCVTQFDYPLKPGMRVSVSKTKRNQNVLRSRYVKIVYEDQYIVVVDKAVGILSMAACHSSLNVKAVLDDYFHKSKQHCQAHVVHRLDRDTSGLMIYAKDMQTEQALERDWHGIVYDRRYVALLSGRM